MVREQTSHLFHVELHFLIFRDIVSPMLVRPYSIWANFKTDISMDRNNPNEVSNEYKTIVTNKRK